MVVLSVIGGLLLLLALACLWESRSGRPEWGRRATGEAITPQQAAKQAKAQIAAAATAAVLFDMGGGDG